MSGAVVLLGILALSRPSRAVVAALSLGACGVVWGLVMTYLPLLPAGAETATRGWPGPSTLLTAAGVVLAGAILLSDLGSDLLRPRVAFFLILAAITPVVSLLMWFGGAAEGVMFKSFDSAVPPVGLAEAQSDSRSRTLVMRRSSDGRVGYTIVNARPPQLGDAEVPPRDDVLSHVGGVVEDVAAARAGVEIDQLDHLAVRYVVLADPSDTQLRKALDSEPGLRRLAAGDQLLWRVSGDNARARVQSAGDAGVQEQSLPARPESVDADIPADPAAPLRRVLMAVGHSPGWKATVDGQAVPSARVPTAADGWQASFAIPPSGGRLSLWFDHRLRWASVATEALAWLAVLVLALPRARREEDPDEVAADGADAGDPTDPTADDPAVDGPAVDPIVAPLPARTGVRLP